MEELSILSRINLQKRALNHIYDNPKYVILNKSAYKKLLMELRGSFYEICGLKICLIQQNQPEEEYYVDIA